MPSTHLSRDLISGDCNHRSSQGQTLSDAIVRSKALVKLLGCSKRARPLSHNWPFQSVPAVAAGNGLRGLQHIVGSLP